MVSHGLTIRQLFFILFDEMGCVSKVPGISDHTELLTTINFSKASTNTSWSRFVIEVSVDDHDVIKSVECQEVFNDEHLKDIE